MLKSKIVHLKKIYKFVLDYFLEKHYGVWKKVTNKSCTNFFKTFLMIFKIQNFCEKSLHISRQNTLIICRNAWSNYPWSRHAQVKKNSTNQGHTLMTAVLNIMHSNYAATTRLHSKETWPSSGYARLERNWDLDGSDHGWLNHVEMYTENRARSASIGDEIKFREETSIRFCYFKTKTNL